MTNFTIDHHMVIYASLVIYGAGSAEVVSLFRRVETAIPCRSSPELVDRSYGKDYNKTIVHKGHQ